MRSLASPLRGCDKQCRARCATAPSNRTDARCRSPWTTTARSSRGAASPAAASHRVRWCSQGGHRADRSGAACTRWSSAGSSPTKQRVPGTHPLKRGTTSPRVLARRARRAAENAASAAQKRIWVMSIGRTRLEFTLLACSNRRVGESEIIPEAFGGPAVGRRVARVVESREHAGMIGV